MAGQIKGMTIEIGGNTAPLNQALKETNKEISNTQKELNQVNKLLKLDPHNTELLAEKQKLLTQAVDQTSTKLEALKKAKATADEQMKNGTEVNKEEYLKLQTEIVKTKNQLAGYKDELDEVGDKYDLLGKRATDMNQAMQVAGAGVLALGTALVGTALKAGQTADDINALSAQTGLSTEQIQKFKFASDTIDVSLETLTGSMAKLTKNMANAKKGTGDTYEAFNKLGISVTDAQGELRNNQDVFNETIKALGNMENETERDALAMQIFGKSAQDLNPLIKGGAEQLEELGNKAQEMGLILSQDALDSANDLQDGVDFLKSTVSSAVTQIGADLSQYLIPVIESVQNMVKWILDNKQPIVTALAAITAGILAFNMVTMIQGMVQAFQAWRVATEGMTVAQALLNAVMSANPLALVISLIAAVVTAIGVFIATNEDFRNKLVETWDNVKQTALDVWNRVVQFFTVDIPNAFNVTVEFLKNVWSQAPAFITEPINNALTFLNDLIPKFMGWVQETIDAISNGFNKMANIGKNIVEGLWEGIKNAKDWLFKKIKEWCGSILDGIKGFFGIESPSKVMANEVGKFMAEGVGVGFNNTMPSVVKAMQDKLATVTDAMQTELAFGDIPQIQGNQIVSENSYVTRNYTNTIETVRQPQTVELVLDGTKLARTLIQPLDNEYNRLGVKI